jgi:hypothetical protein
MNNPYPASAARQYPPGEKPDRRRIEKCSESGAWYAAMIGQTTTVHYFASFGAWDTKGRWLWYYDLSELVIEATPVKRKINWLKKYSNESNRPRF